MADIDIELEKKSKSNINATAQFETYGEVVEFDSEDDIYTSGTQTNIELNPECIEIEITGLKSFDSFIGLTDTPLYYDNGKFFKVVDDKIVYTDITWADIQGSIAENTELEQQIKDIAKEYNEQFVVDVASIKIDEHNKDINAHEYIQNVILDNYTNLNNNINILSNKIDSDVNKLSNNISQNTNALNVLTEEQIKNTESINLLDVNTKNNTVLIQNTRNQLNELENDIELNLNKLNTELQQSNDKINNNTTNIERNYLLISDIINDTKEYAKKQDLSKVAFTGEYNDILNKPDIPSLEGYATTTYVNQRIDNAIGEISGFDFLVVDRLPSVGESGHIYLVLHQHGNKDIYDEYIWVQDIQSFEKIGTTDVDLSNYYIKNEVNSLLSNKVDKRNGYSLISDIEINRLSNIKNYDDTSLKQELSKKQNRLTSGENIIITHDNVTNSDIISAKDTVYTAGEGISIENNIITNTNISAEWGNIVGDINTQTDLNNLLNSKLETKIDTNIFEQELSKKQDILTSGNGIDIVNNTISGTTIIFRDWSI